MTLNPKHAAPFALIAVVSCAVALTLGCGHDDNSGSTASNRGDLRVTLPDQTDPVRQGDYDFGDVKVGTNKKVTLQLVNVGSDLAKITATRFEDAPAGTFFAMAPSEVGAGETANLSMTFAPTQTGPVTGRLVIEHNGTSLSLSLNLTGNGTP